MCESLLGTLLNVSGKTRDHANARADLEEMGIRPELWLNDLDGKVEQPAACITL